MNDATAIHPFRALAFAMCLLSMLAGCSVTPDTGVPEANASTSADVIAAPVDPETPGTLHFILSPSGAGNYSGWQLQVLSAIGQSGFRPFLSGVMSASESLRAEVYPGRYRARVLLNGDVLRDERIEVSAGAPTVVSVDIGFLTNRIDVLRGEEARRLVARTGVSRHDMLLAQTFPPTPVALPKDNPTPAPAPQIAQAAPAVQRAAEPARPAIDGCTDVEGKFTADGGLSRLSFDGDGRGQMWQQTYGGSAVYTFEIEFSYSGTRDSMRFDYGPGVYKDASGTVLDQKTIPSGDARCDYDGATITINGKPFSK